MLDTAHLALIGACLLTWSGSARAVAPPVAGGPIVAPSAAATPASAAVPAAAPAPAPPPSADAAPSSARSGLRALGGTIGGIDRGQQPLALYLDRMEAALYLEKAHGTAGPYVVSIAISLEEMTDKDRAGRGERLLLDAYLLLSGYTGPQGGRLADLYVVALAPLLNVPRGDVAVTPELNQELRRMGDYAAAAAQVRLARLSGAERAGAEVHLQLARGRYPEAAKAAQALMGLAPSQLARSLLFGARLLGGDQSKAKELLELEKGGGAAGNLAALFLRRAARESLAIRLSSSLTGSAVPAGVRKAAAMWQRPGAKGKKNDGLLTDQPLSEACGLLLDSAVDARRLPRQAVDCAYFLSEGSGATWSARDLPTQGTGNATGNGAQRVALLNLSRGLGTLVGLPGRPPSRDAKERGEALAQVARLLPDSGLSAADAFAVMLVAQIAAGSGPRKELHPAIDKYLHENGCAPGALALPLSMARYGNDVGGQKKALQDLLARCAADADDEVLRVLSLALLDLDSPPGSGPAADLAWRTLREVAARHAKEPGEGRYDLSLADGEALRLFTRKLPPSAAELMALEKHYKDASARLLPWDGADLKGRAESQIVTLLLRRHQLGPSAQTAGVLDEVDRHLRYAQLLATPIEGVLVQGMEVYAGREQALARRRPVAAPKLDVTKVPAGVGRRYLSCELARTARAANDQGAYGRFAQGAAGGPVPDVVDADKPRLVPSLGVDGRLRLTVHGTDSLLVLPRCSL